MHAKNSQTTVFQQPSHCSVILAIFLNFSNLSFVRPLICHHVSRHIVCGTVLDFDVSFANLLSDEMKFYLNVLRSNV